MGKEIKIEKEEEPKIIIIINLMKRLGIFIHCKKYFHVCKKLVNFMFFYNWLDWFDKIKRN